MPFGTQVCIAKNILLCLQQNLSQYWEHQYPMNSTSYNLRHKENDNHTYHLYICYIYQNHLYCLPEQARSHQGRGKTEAVALWPPESARRLKQRRVISTGRSRPSDKEGWGGGEGRSAKIFWGLKIRGARVPRAAPLDPQLIRSKANSDVADDETNAHD